MIDGDLLESESDALNSLISSTPIEVRHAIYVWFTPADLRQFFTSNANYHTKRLMEFLLSNSFVKLRSYRPEYELLDEGKKLFKIGSLQRYYEMESNKTLNIYGDNNIVNIAHNGGIAQNAAITGTQVTSETKVPSSIFHSKIVSPEQSAVKCGCPDFFCWNSKIYFGGKILSPQKIFDELFKYRLDEIPMSDFKRRLLFLLDNNFRTTTSRREINFQAPLKDAGAVNHYKERSIRLAENSIEYQFAQYKSQSGLITDLHEEFMPLLALIYFCKTFYRDAAFDINISIAITTNRDAQFVYSPQGIFSVEGLITSSYLFHEGSELVNKHLPDTDNATIIDLMQDIAGLFVTDSKYVQNPYMLIDIGSQNLALNHVKEVMKIG